MWYLKKMATMPDYDTFKDSVNYIEPNVSYITNDDKVMFNSYVKKTYVYIDGRKYEFEGEITYKDFIETVYKGKFNINGVEFETESVYYEEYNAFMNLYTGYISTLKYENFENVPVDKIIEDGERVILYGDSRINIDDWYDRIQSNITWEKQLNWHDLVTNYICDYYFNDKSFFIDEEGYVKSYRIIVYSDGSLGWCVGNSNSFYLKYEDGTKVKGTDLTIANHNYKLFSVDELNDFEIRD